MEGFRQAANTTLDPVGTRGAIKATGLDHVETAAVRTDTCSRQNKQFHQRPLTETRFGLGRFNRRQITKQWSCWLRLLYSDSKYLYFIVLINRECVSGMCVNFNALCLKSLPPQPVTILCVGLKPHDEKRASVGARRRTSQLSMHYCRSTICISLHTTYDIVTYLQLVTHGAFRISCSSSELVVAVFFTKKRSDLLLVPHLLVWPSR